MSDSIFFTVLTGGTEKKNKTNYSWQQNCQHHPKAIGNAAQDENIPVWTLAFESIVISTTSFFFISRVNRGHNKNVAAYCDNYPLIHLELIENEIPRGRCIWYIFMTRVIVIQRSPSDGFPAKNTTYIQGWCILCCQSEGAVEQTVDSIGVKDVICDLHDILNYCLCLLISSTYNYIYLFMTCNASDEEE